MALKLSNRVRFKALKLSKRATESVWFQNKFWVGKKILVWKKFWSEKILVRKKNFGPKKKKIWVKKKFDPKIKNFVPKKNLGQKKIWSEKNLVQKFLVWNALNSYLFMPSFLFVYLFVYVFIYFFLSNSRLSPKD